jgi:hypothetical protein
MTCRSWWRRIGIKSFGGDFGRGRHAGRELSLGVSSFRRETPDGGHLQGLLAVWQHLVLNLASPSFSISQHLSANVQPEILQTRSQNFLGNVLLGANVSNPEACDILAAHVVASSPFSQRSELVCNDFLKVVFGVVLFSNKIGHFYHEISLL